MEVNNGNGLFDKYGMIDGVIVQLNNLEVKGAVNMTIVIDCIQRLGALRKGMKEEEANANSHNE